MQPRGRRSVKRTDVNRDFIHARAASRLIAHELCKIKIIPVHLYVKSQIRITRANSLRKTRVYRFGKL